jgi:hypothetical protein
MLHQPNLDKTLRFPVQHRIQVKETVLKQEHPIVYDLPHCSKKGEPPTKVNTLRLWTRWKYVKEYDEKQNGRWKTADELARKIDF